MCLLTLSYQGKWSGRVKCMRHAAVKSGCHSRSHGQMPRLSARDASRPELRGGLRRRCRGQDVRPHTASHGCSRALRCLRGQAGRRSPLRVRHGTMPELRRSAHHVCGLKGYWLPASLSQGSATPSGPTSAAYCSGSRRRRAASALAASPMAHQVGLCAGSPARPAAASKISR